MKSIVLVLGVAVAVVLAAFAYVMIGIDQTREAQLPDVDVQVEGGRLPELEVETGRVEITEETKEITVPDIDIKPAPE